MTKKDDEPVRSFVHGTGAPDETITPEEALSEERMNERHRAAIRRLEEASERALREPLVLDLDEGAMPRALRALGLPTRNANGHELGCRCAPCAAVRAEQFDKMRVRYQNGEPPETLGELLAKVLQSRKAKGH